MPTDPYAILRALVRAEAARSTPTKPRTDITDRHKARPVPENDRGR
ncbi:hypothetical protein NFX46_39020 [Streptomyces phaeoluteigriseus]|uniref:Uncharacterized protein n=1 Tax=Streptomyces phaeoluteigriseus TaxID=114686 RepID=A0ABY4ZJY5_9ACTN|nr:hypothetical protein [Streptomyces phaeoluteigriseus]USQ89206.1 hypothetical protein NFX46_39020 [Streptomyces phaeoluteigriseus]